MSELTLDYELTGTGWASLRIEQGEVRLELVDLSYLDEPLHDLLEAGLDAALRRPPIERTFDNEGAFTRLRIQSSRDEEPPAPARLRIDAATRVWSADAWTPLGEIDTDSETFARAALACGEAVLARHGVEAYDRQWCGEGFPLRALTALRAALAVTEPVGAKYAEG